MPAPDVGLLLRAPGDPGDADARDPAAAPARGARPDRDGAAGASLSAGLRAARGHRLRQRSAGPRGARRRDIRRRARPISCFRDRRRIDLAVERPAGPITLVVVDGTWWQARKLLKRNARAGGAAPAPLHAARAEPLPDPARAGRPLRGDGRGAGADAGRAGRGARAVRHAAASVRGDDRHPDPLRDDRARGAPPPCASPDAQGATPHHLDDAARARREPRLRSRRGERLAGAAPRRTSRGDRPLGGAAPPDRRDLRGGHQAAPPAGAGNPAPHPDQRRAAGGGRELERLPRALGGVRARGRLRLQLGTISARPPGGRGGRAAEGAPRHAPRGRRAPGRAHRIGRGLHDAPGRRGGASRSPSGAAARGWRR